VDAKTVAIQRLNRLQNQNDFLLANAASGAVTRVFRDQSSTWVNDVDEVRWIDKGRAFLWTSERDGWQHVYRVPRDGGDATLVTRMDADVIDVVGLERGGRLAVPDRLTAQRHAAISVSNEARTEPASPSG